jgi:hypothetical protein
MNKENDILAELKNIGSSLAGISRAMPYSVPGDYFEKLPGNTLAVIKHIEEPEIEHNWGKAMPFHVPAGYFENLTGNLVANATGHVSVQAKEMPLQVPVGYFENLPRQVLKKVKGTNPKQIPLTGANIFRRIQWAAAAVFILFMGIGAYITFFSDHSVNTDKILASVPANEIHDYLQHTYRIDVDKVVGNNDINNLQLDNKEIVQYLNETGWDVIE